MSEPESARIAGLDGLRGLAALVVVLGHCVLASSVALDDAATTGRSSGAAWAWTFTPLHMVWAGSEAVIVFFVLSGFVLTRPIAAGRRFVGRSYYPRRLARLYLPVWGAVVLAAGIHFVPRRHSVMGATGWLNEHGRASLTFSAAAKDATLVLGAGDFGFTTVLWSLRWEVLFSLALPLFAFGAIYSSRTRGRSLCAAGASLLLIAASPNDYVHYLPTFFLGALLAVAYARGRMRVTSSRITAAAIVVITVLLITSRWWGDALVENAAGPERLIRHLSFALVAVGAVLAVGCSMQVMPVAELLSRNPAQWLGSRSYSLYLVHEPIVVSTAFAMGGRPPFWELSVIAIPASLVVAEAFWWVIERPAIRLAHLVAVAVDRRRATFERPHPETY